MLIHSRSNNKIKHLRGLAQSKQRQAAQEFVLEGPQLLGEALQAGYELRQLFCLTDHERPSWAKQAKECFELPTDLMAYASSLKSAPSAIGILGLRQPQANLHRRPGWLVTENLQDPGNFGALLRLADAMGWRGILALGEHPDPFQAKVLRGSMGSALRLPVQPLSLAELPHWQAKGWTLVCTRAQAPIQSTNWPVPAQVLLALGHEGQGLSAALLALAQQELAIPMQPGVDSLNVVTAAAMLVHEATRQWPERSVTP